MKTCIWCLKTEAVVAFKNEAHTFPKSLGGKNICEAVCDSCNSFFGSSRIETVFKEILNTSKYLILSTTNQLKSRYKSEFFDIDFKNKKIKYKLKYRLRKSFKEMIGRKFRQGLYKVFLEERERILGDAKDSRFDFIRRFSRYDLDDCPLFIWEPRKQIVLSEPSKIDKPELEFSDYNLELDKEFRMFEYHIMGHFFALPTSDSFELVFEKYCEKKISEGMNRIYFFKRIINIDDIDFTFKYLNS